MQQALVPTSQPMSLIVKVEWGKEGKNDDNDDDDDDNIISIIMIDDDDMSY